MAHKIFDEAYRKRILLAAANGAVNFAFARGRKPGEDVFVCDRKLDAEKLFKRVRQETKLNKVAYGTITADGSTLIMRCEKPLTGLKKRFKELAKEAGLKQKKCKVLGPDGLEVLDPDDDHAADGALDPDLTPAAPQSGGTATPDTATDPEPAVADLAAEQRQADQLEKLWAGTLKEVAKQIDKLRAELATYNDPAHLSIREGLAGVMAKFPDLDLGKLKKAAASGDRAVYDNTLRQTAGEVKQCRDLLARGPLLSTIDQNPFLKTTVHRTVGQVLDGIEKKLGI